MGPLDRIRGYLGRSADTPDARKDDERPWWDRGEPDWPEPWKSAPRVDRYIGNQVFLLALDDLVRKALQRHEREELLGCAERVAAALDVRPATGPVEGYYAEHPDLIRYCQLLQTLRRVPLDCEKMVADLPDYRRLLRVTSSLIFGSPEREYLLPAPTDPLAAALAELPVWSVQALTTRAGLIARETDDCSLVGLAARAEDPVVLAALRESVVLYALADSGASLVQVPRYEWAVEPTIAEPAGRFVTVFNELFGPELPPPQAKYARVFWDAYKRADVVGRCVRLGEEMQGETVSHYHWVVVRQVGERLGVHEFRDAHVWTTAAYRKGKRSANRQITP